MSDDTEQGAAESTLVPEPIFQESEIPQQEWVGEVLSLSDHAKAYRDAAYAEAKRIVEEAEAEYNAALFRAKGLKDAADAAMETADADDR